ncbi:MAG: retropepsin-like domain-containing protein [Solirubrobacterales bacterium]|nr:retropepsin-like domain-containing protein [Solirubrobacterales bacterium]
MRRLIAVAGLVGSFLLVGFTGWGNASVGGGAHATSIAPLEIVKLKDGETLALARVIIHGRAFPFLIDTGSSKTLVDDSLAKQLHLKTVGRPIKVTGVGCSEGARKVRLSNWSIGGQALPRIVATSSVIAGANGHAFGLLGSDVLSHFGTISIDYAHGVLTLG